jgi:hypothetical protein
LERERQKIYAGFLFGFSFCKIGSWVRCIPPGGRWGGGRRRESESPICPKVAQLLALAPQIQLQFHSCNWDLIPQFQFRIGTHTAKSIPYWGPNSIGQFNCNSGQFHLQFEFQLELGPDSKLPLLNRDPSPTPGPARLFPRILDSPANKPRLVWIQRIVNAGSTPAAIQAR